MNKTSSKEIRIFDTTLRDGQQCPWAGMTIAQNIKFAHMLAETMKWWNHIIEVWFPSANETEFEIARQLSNEIWSIDWWPIIAWLCQLRNEWSQNHERQIDRTINALEPWIKFWKSRLHTYVPVDPILAKASIGLDFNDSAKKTDIVEKTKKLISIIVSAWIEVEFSTEWYSMFHRKNMNNESWTLELIQAAIEWWATTINFPDTIWWSHFMQWEKYFINNINKHIKELSKRYPDKHINWSIHCHNDLGQAVTNSMNAICMSNINQIECTINWVGERAWNANMQEILMAIKLYWENQWIKTTFDISKLQKLSDYIAKHMIPRQPNSPINWNNSARHTSWWHVNAMRRDWETYHIFDPETVWNSIELVFWPSSWWWLAQEIIKKNWYICLNEEKSNIASFIIEYYKDRRKWITDDELMQVYFEYRIQNNENTPIIVNWQNPNTWYSKQWQDATINLIWKFFWKKDISKKIQSWSSALAALKDVIDQEWNQSFTIKDSSSSMEWDWKDATSIHKIIIKNWWTYTWIWKDQDIEIAALKALINAVNKAYICEWYKN